MKKIPVLKRLLKPGSAFNIFIENPLGTWWKLHKYFILPKICIQFSFGFHIDWKAIINWWTGKTVYRFHEDIFIYYLYTFPYASYNTIGKILDIHCSDIMWKDKYDSPRFERPPHIFICLFRLFAIHISWHIPYIDELGKQYFADDEYWEWILNILHYNGKLHDVPYMYHTSKVYKTWDYETEVKRPVNNVIQLTNICLNKSGLKQLRNEILNQFFSNPLWINELF